MSLVVAPESLTAAATGLADIQSAIRAANAAATAPTTALVAAGADEISTAIASLFAENATAYQALSAQAAAFHDHFAQLVNGAAGAYAGSEAASVGLLQTLGQEVWRAINAPTELLLGRPLIGDGVDGGTDAHGVGTPGGAGGILWGNGGNGGNSTAVGAAGGAGGSAGLLGSGGAGGLGGWGATGGSGGAGGWLLGIGGAGGTGGYHDTIGGQGGAGGPAGLIGIGGAGGIGGLWWGSGVTSASTGGAGGAGGTGGWLLGIGGTGGTGAPLAPGGTGGAAGWIGLGGTGGHGGELATGGAGGRGGLLIGLGGDGGTGGVLAFGGPAGAGGLLGTDGHAGAFGGSASAALTMEGGVNPMITISVGGGPEFHALLDTGSSIVIVPPQYVDIASLGPKIGSSFINFGQAPSLETNYYDVYQVPVNLGNGIITRPTYIAVVTSATQTNTITGMVTPLNPQAVEPIFGVAANITSPPYFSTSPNQALPGVLADGVLVHEPKGYAQFGPNPLSSDVAILGAPLTVVNVSVNGGPPQQTAIVFDTGGRAGFIPSDLVGGLPVGSLLPAGTTITVTTTGGIPLYTQVVGDTRVPVVTTPTTDDNFYNTGYYPFSLGPIYIGYSPTGTGLLAFDVAAGGAGLLATGLANQQAGLLDAA